MIVGHKDNIRVSSLIRKTFLRKLKFFLIKIEPNMFMSHFMTKLNMKTNQKFHLF